MVSSSLGNVLFSYKFVKDWSNLLDVRFVKRSFDAIVICVLDQSSGLHNRLGHQIRFRVPKWLGEFIDESEMSGWISMSNCPWLRVRSITSICQVFFWKSERNIESNCFRFKFKTVAIIPNMIDAYNLQLKPNNWKCILEEDVCNTSWFQIRQECQVSGNLNCIEEF